MWLCVVFTGVRPVLFVLIEKASPWKKVAKMEAIKKKMQALKIEKDNAMDRAEAAENQLRDSNIRVEKVDLSSSKRFIGACVDTLSTNTLWQ